MLHHQHVDCLGIPGMLGGVSQYIARGQGADVKVSEWEQVDAGGHGWTCEERRCRVWGEEAPGRSMTCVKRWGARELCDKSDRGTGMAQA
jgi:hypothetical protein